MAVRKQTKRGAKKPSRGFTEAEQAAIKERAGEARPRPRGGKPEGEHDLLAKIAEMHPSSRAMTERLHALVKIHAPTLAPKTWYGMPAYAKDDQVVL